MNTRNNSWKLFTLCALAVALVSLAPFGAKADGTVSYERITTEEQLKSLPSGTQVAMACAKCKTVMIDSVGSVSAGQGGLVSWFEPKTEHKCPGCGGTWTYVSKAKGAQRGYVHTCSKCGSSSMFCCSSAAGGRTKGM